MNLQVFADKSIVEVFSQGGRAVVTARVYPTLPQSTKIGVYTTSHGAVGSSAGAEDNSRGAQNSHAFAYRAEAWHLRCASS